jgi:hypothetical protein
MKLWLIPLLFVSLAAVQEPATPGIRHSATARQFMKDTGYPNGRPGWIVDHIVPLCAGGADTPTNMQWQTKADSLKKDAFERQLCALMRKYNLEFVQMEQKPKGSEPMVKKPS